jgi:hypothetical protein
VRKNHRHVQNVKTIVRALRVLQMQHALRNRGLRQNAGST